VANSYTFIWGKKPNGKFQSIFIEKWAGMSRKPLTALTGNKIMCTAKYTWLKPSFIFLRNGKQAIS